MEKAGVVRTSGDWGIGEKEAQCPKWFLGIHILDGWVALLYPQQKKGRTVNFRVSGAAWGDEPPAVGKGFGLNKWNKAVNKVAGA